MILVSRTDWAGMPFARTVRPRAWLSTWSGLTSNADLVANVARILEPKPGEREAPHVERAMDRIVPWIQERFS